LGEYFGNVIFGEFNRCTDPAVRGLALCDKPPERAF